ncbi:MAG: methyl-accepting chemotaxis protein [Syntrophobacteraceae bacterium]
MDGKHADEVLAGNTRSYQYLKEIEGGSENNGKDFQSLSASLQKYRSTFQHLVKNDQKISSLKLGVNKSLDQLLAKSDQLFVRINNIRGMTLMQGGDSEDSSLNALIIASKAIATASSELVLAVDRDLLLDNNEKAYLDRLQRASADLKSAGNNASAVVGMIKEKDLKQYPVLIEGILHSMQTDSREIERLWRQNRDLVGQLNKARDEILAKDASLMGATRKRLNQIKHSGAVLNSASMGLIFLILIAGGTLIGRSITSAIRRISEKLRESAEWTAMAAGQMSSTSQSLAEGASEQAAALEETTSSLEEMASMTRSNAQNAQGSNALMKEISRIVEQSNQSMLKLKDSMEDISTSSQETQAIVKTIDEISFQTNLLALNAAVEAARAGEAGAGFAVVADEVRNLAMRAADAARNTADLIEKTVKKVQDGAAVATLAYGEFSHVSGSISKAVNLMEEVAQSSQEQAGGAEQINRAVSEMDKVTQQNAANAEESASVCEELSTRARGLTSLVADLVSLVGSAA